MLAPLFRASFPLVFAAATVLGCGGPALDGSVYRQGALSFRVGRIPSSWRPIEADGALLAFRDSSAEASIAVNGRCGKDGDDVPLEALTHHLFLEFTDRKLDEQSLIQLDGRDALHTELRAKLDGVERRFSVFVLKKNGCVYDFMYVAPPDAPAEGQRRFVAFVEGFSTIKP